MTVAAPSIFVEIKGATYRLDPVTLYEITLAEEAYIAKLERQFELRTEGMSEARKLEERERLAIRVLALEDNYGEVMRWFLLTRQGQMWMVLTCLRSANPGVDFTIRDVAEWYKKDRTEVLQKWFVSSGLLADPTKVSSVEETAAVGTETESQTTVSQ